MARPSRHPEELLEAYRKYWGNATYADVWNKNARLYLDREALVDHRVRLTWAQANLRKVWSETVNSELKCQSEHVRQLVEEGLVVSSGRSSC